MTDIELSAPDEFPPIGTVLRSLLIPSLKRISPFLVLIGIMVALPDYQQSWIEPHLNTLAFLFVATLIGSPLPTLIDILKNYSSPSFIGLYKRGSASFLTLFKVAFWLQYALALLIYINILAQAVMPHFGPGIAD
jgi:hypothetical protein